LPAAVAAGVPAGKFVVGVVDLVANVFSCCICTFLVDVYLMKLV
jgi:hypothetical protein